MQIKILTIATIGIICALVLLTAATCPLAADESALDDQTREVIARIKERESSLHTFSARFYQIQKSRLFDNVVRSEGSILYDAGGKLLFRIDQPLPLAVVFNQDWVQILDPEKGQIRKRHLGTEQGILRRYFGVGQPLADLMDKFELKAIANAPLPGYTLEMVPKQNRIAKHVKRISAVVDATTWLPREVFIELAQEDWTRIHLQFIDLNQPLPPNAFDLESRD